MLVRSVWVVSSGLLAIFRLGAGWRLGRLVWSAGHLPSWCWLASAALFWFLGAWCEVVRVGSSATMVVGASDLPKPFHKNPELHKGRSASRANAARYQQNSDLQPVYPLGCEG